MGTLMTSKYQQIIADLELAMQSNQFKKGDKLPSIRQLSQQYHCSKDTVQRALLALQYKRLIYAIPKSGYYVLGKIEEKQHSFELSLEDYNQLAYEDFRLCLNEALDGKDSDLFNYYHKAEGLEELRKALLPYLADNGIYANKNQLLITSGTQQALYILAQMRFPNGRHHILLETPTYHRMEQLATSLGLPYQTIERDFNGINLHQLESIFKTGQIAFFYTISRFSNPLGLSYSKKEKESIVRLAEQYQVYIVEDDYLGDFAPHSELPLHYYDTQQRVIYLKSFSMSVFPALRIGALLLPDDLKEGFLLQKSMIDLDTNLIMQKALALYLANGMFQKNLKQIRQFFNNRAHDLLDFLQKHLPSLAYQLTPQALIIQLDKAFNRKKLLKTHHAQIISTRKARYLILTISPDMPSKLLDLFSVTHEKTQE